MTWTEKEIQFLRDNYKTMKQKDMLEHLPGRGRCGVERKMTELGLRRKEMWTPEQIKYLKEHYSNGHIDDIQAYLKMSFNKIHQKASQLKITGNRYGLDAFRGATGRKRISREIADPNEHKWKRDNNRLKYKAESKYKTRVVVPGTLRCVKINKRTWLYIDMKKTEVEENTIIDYYHDVLTHKSNFIKGRPRNFNNFKKAG